MECSNIADRDLPVSTSGFALARAIGYYDSPRLDRPLVIKLIFMLSLCQ